ncbi:lipocalin family protein [Oceaniglobus roseus]|uniref:lipocalin family protein n=1 Tax=Oceaniglobus roseus TaxID=1737570 RepID=UPI001FE678B5|nr:lipocalin family protein [Kandeliimicrobium roseum]
MHRLIPFLLALAACSSEIPLPPGTVPVYRDTSVPISSIALFDPARYAGTWYEVARFPVAFEKGCVGTTATYAPLPDGGLSVVNLCREGALDGPVKRIEGRAEVTGPGRLTVTFDQVPFLSSPYWVLWVDEGYRTAVVGVPSGRAGWILNRDPQIPADRLAAAKEILDFNGYDVSKLMTVPQGAR